MKRTEFNALFPPVAKPSRDTQDFLEALLFTLPENSRGEIPDWSIHDFHPEFVAAVESFCDGFRAYLSDLRETAPDPDLLDPDATGRACGGNVYFSLSGHGVGFWDDSEGEALQSALEAFAGGNRHRFEEMDLAKFSGKIHLAFRTADFRREYLAKFFSVTPQPVTP